MWLWWSTKIQKSSLIFLNPIVASFNNLFTAAFNLLYTSLPFTVQSVLFTVYILLFSVSHFTSFQTSVQGILPIWTIPTFWHFANQGQMLLQQIVLNLNSRSHFRESNVSSWPTQDVATKDKCCRCWYFLWPTPDANPFSCNKASASSSKHRRILM